MCEEGKSLYDLIVSRRTVRRFKPQAVPRETLERIVDAGRLAPSASNMQPLAFVVVESRGRREKIFPCLKWAAFIAPEGDPPPGREPMAYIVTLVDARVRDKMFEYDVGAAMENMILAAMGEGLGSCWLLSVDRDKVREILDIPAEYRIDCVLALGTPDEEPVAEEMGGSHRYWKDAEGRLHVPKRPFSSVVRFA